MRKSFVFLEAFQELGKGVFSNVKDTGKQPQGTYLYFAICI